MERVGGGTGAAGHRGRWAGLVVGGIVLAVLAVAGAFAVSPAAGLWVLAALAAALLLGGATAAWAGRRPGPAPVPTPGSVPTPTAGSDTPPVREVDDLQAFFDSPPGAPADGTGRIGPDTPVEDPVPTPAPVTAPVSAPAPAPAPAPISEDAHRTTVRRIAVGATAALLVVVVGAAVAAAVTRDRDTSGREDGGRGGVDGATASTTAPPPRPSASASAAPLTAAAAGDLAGVVVPLGREGLQADLVFDGIVLEPRAVGSTVTRPALALSSDGGSGVAHLELPTWNCLSATAPADPGAAGCTPGPTEYADLGTPDLQVEVSDGSFDLTGDFPTYTRPNGSPPAYTGRTYAVSVTGGVSGRPQGGEATAAGRLTLGGATVATRTGTDLNVVRAAG